MPRQEQVLDPDFAAALEYLAGSGEHLATATLFALSDVNRAELQRFAATWVMLPAEQRRRVALALADLAEENIEVDFCRLFRHMLDDEDAEVREQAINGLWENEEVSLINPLIGALRSDADARVRAAAAEGLGRFVLLSETNRIPHDRGEQINEALLAVIRNPGEDLRVRRRAIESIAYLGDETVRDIIISTYADDDAQMRATAIFAMGRSADPYWRRILAQELYSPNPELRFEAARAAGELEYKAAVPRLIELLEDADRELQAAAITALGQIGGKQAKAALQKIQQDEDETYHELAQDALDELEFNNGSELLLYDLDLAGATKPSDPLALDGDQQDLALDDGDNEAEEDEEDEEDEENDELESDLNDEDLEEEEDEE